SIIADLPLTEEKHVMTELLPPMFSFISIWNTITINYKNGTSIQLKSKIHKGEYCKAFEAIKSQSNIEITVLGLTK
ncbi:MAG: hypothetical protein MUE72_08375, partial [Chitinophagaceae bacterium]|nr:hypothetical protein [Chitinophagaceae bacterium]